MKRSERRQFIITAAALGGGVLGGGLGAALGGVVGGAIGGIPGVALPLVFGALPNLVNRTPILGRSLRKRALATEIKRKLELEFVESVPSDSTVARELFQEEARVIAGTPEFGAPGTVRMVRPPPVPQPASSSRESYIELLRQVSPIRVVCPSICPSVVSVFKALHLHLPASVKLQIDFSPENSGEITKRYASERWNFCAISRLAILATNRHIDETLLQVAPLYRVSQCYVVLYGVGKIKHAAS